jgi:hypothetical protein
MAGVFRQLLAAGVVLSCLVVAPVAGQTQPDSGLLLEHVRVFDAVRGTFSAPANVLIRGTRIEAIGDLRASGSGVVRIDAAGRYALPGLWDSHVHFSFLKAGSDSALAATLDAFVRNGVTSVRDVGGPLDTIAAISRLVERGSLVGPRIYFAGPMLSKPPLSEMISGLNREMPGFGLAVTSRADVDSILDRLVAGGATMTKAFENWDPTLFRHYVAVARARGLRVVLDPGSAIMNPIPIDTALAVGVSSVEHAQAVWVGVLRADLEREVDALGNKLVSSGALQFRIMTLGEASVSRQRLAALAGRWARNGIYFCPTLIRAQRSLEENPPEKARRPFEGRLAVGRVFVRELSARGVKLLVGQDFIQPDETFAEMELLAAAGVRPIEVLRGATLYPAEFLGREDSVGTIARGKRADIVILDANPLVRMEHIRSVWRVVHDGKLVPPKNR